jgi:hypothetical protein
MKRVSGTTNGLNPLGYTANHNPPVLTGKFMQSLEPPNFIFTFVRNVKSDYELRHMSVRPSIRPSVHPSVRPPAQNNSTPT